MGEGYQLLDAIVITIVMRQKAVDCRTFESFRNEGIYLWDRRGKVYVPCMMGEGSKCKRVRRGQAPDVPLCMA